MYILAEDKRQHTYNTKKITLLYVYFSRGLGVTYIYFSEKGAIICIPLPKNRFFCI